MFLKKYITPLLSPYFIETEYLEVTRCGEESRGLKDRRGNKLGRKPDTMCKIVVDQNNQSVFFSEIKSKEQYDMMAHSDFSNLANSMKGEVDRLLFENYPIEIPIYGMLHAFILDMDPDYTGLYRLFDVVSFCFPTPITDLAIIDHTFNSMF